MQFRFGKIIMLLSVAGVVAACNKSSVDTAPDKLVRDGVQRLWNQDKKFNFSGVITLEVGEEVENSKNNTNSLASSASTSQPITGSDVAMIDERDSSQHPLNQYQDLLSWLGSSFTVPYTGAVDLTKGKVEIIPEYRYSAENALISFKFPIQLDIDKLALYIDSSAVTNVSDALLKRTQPAKVIGNRYLQIVVPQEMRQHLPINDLIKAIPKAMDDGFASIDKKSFATVSVDDYGKQLNAKYQVKFTSNGKENIRMTVAILDSLSKNLEQQGQQAVTKKGQYQQQDYVKLKQTIDSVSSIYKKLLDRNIQKTPYTESIKEREKMPLVYNYYFDVSGRILAMQGKIQTISASLSPFGKSITMVIDQKINYSEPNFSMKPTEKNTFNLNSQLGLH